MTSRLGNAALATLVGGYVALAIIAGAPNSPLTVLLPNGVRAPTWAATLARDAGLAAIGRQALTGVAWIFVALVILAFVLVVREAWAERIRLGAVLAAAGASLAVSVAAPLLLSRDVYTYAAYGRIETAYHGNPYVTTLSWFPHDPFVAVSSVQWLHTHSHYGPLFTLVSAGIVRTVGSVGGTIFAFKLLAGIAIVAATALVAFAAVRIRPARAPLAAAVVGLNPVIVVHTVGGGHVDAVIAAPLAAATALAVTPPRAISLRAFAITVLLAVACLVKTVMFPVLALWLVWLARADRARGLAVHALVVAAAVAASSAPFAGSHPLAPFASLGGIEFWASPSHLVAMLAGNHLRIAVQAAFLLFFAFLFVRLVRRASTEAHVPIEDWGVALLLLALSLPYLLPWYAAWFVPFVAFVADPVIACAGIFASVVLALTLIPADPFHGLTTPAVMDGVHYGAAPVLLALLVLVASHVAGGRRERLVPLDSPAAGL